MSCSSCGGAARGSGGPGQSVTLFVTSEMEGSIEPCGCTSNPMGDLARTVELVESARKQGRPVAVLDAGSLLYSHVTVPPAQKDQEKLKAALIQDAFENKLKVAAVGLGPYDLAMGAESIKLPRQAVNVAAGQHVPIDPPKVIPVGGVKLGVFGVVDPGAVSQAQVPLKVSDPQAAATRAVADLRGGGAQVVVCLAQMTRSQAKFLARRVKGIDFIVVGQNLPDDPARVQDAPEKVGRTWLVEPANRGQVVSRIDLTVRGGKGDGGFTDAIGQARAQIELGKVDQQIAQLRTDLARWQKDPSADKAFVAQKQRELASLEQRRTHLAASPLDVPEEGNWFTLTQVRIVKALACNAQLEADKVAYDRAAGQANLAAAKAAGKPPAPAAGQAGYVGMDECESCHAKEVAFWKNTVHSHAWHTLEAVGKEANVDCVSCHATGFDKPGGSNLAFNEGLRNVQCEVCHGPGSIHVDQMGKDEPRTVTRTPQPTLCKSCHTPEHSDTFNFEAYLRDVTGPGHGEALRNKLGAGPTGHELRAAALEKAGKNIGAGCKR